MFRISRRSAAFVCVLLVAGLFVTAGISFVSRSHAASPSGQDMPVGDLNGWRQVYTEDFLTSVPIGQFPGTAYRGKIGAYPDGWKDTSKNGTYSPTKVNSVSGGILDWHIRTENGVRLVSAPTPEVPLSAHTYGRYAVRFRSDPIPGYKTAWLLWPDSDVWNDGEIDFPEGNLDKTIGGYSHCAGPNPSQNCLAVESNKTYTTWHTAVIEWIPGKVTFILDGVTLGSTTNQVPTKPMHWVLQTETNLDGYIPSSTAAGHVQVDWIAAWSYSPGTVAPPPPAIPPISQTGNLAAGKPLLSSTAAADDQPAMRANDANSATRWTSAPQDGVTLAADLGANYNLSAVNIIWAGDTTKNYDVQVSADNVSWRTIATGLTNNTTPQRIDHPSLTNASGRYFRILAKDRWNSTYGNSIWELGVYGTAVTPPTGVVGDVNGDARVNALDLSALISRDGQNYPAADFNNDGTVGAADMAILLARWTW
ncbi:MAG TPA: discoidin domain-containing protein [Candidatus Saccharimonadales bacterium]